MGLRTSSGSESRELIVFSGSESAADELNADKQSTVEIRMEWVETTTEQSEHSPSDSDQVRQIHFRCWVTHGIPLTFDRIRG